MHIIYINREEIYKIYGGICCLNANSLIVLTFTERNGFEISPICRGFTIHSDRKVEFPLYTIYTYMKIRGNPLIFTLYTCFRHEQKSYISIKLSYEARKKKNRVTTLLSFLMMRILLFCCWGIHFLYTFS